VPCAYDRSRILRTTGPDIRAVASSRRPDAVPRHVREEAVDQGAWAPLPAFAAATGLRPEEWQALERRDVDRRARVPNVRRTVSSGEVVELGKTQRSRRQVP